MFDCHPQSVLLIPERDRTREVLIELVQQWTRPFPEGIGERAMSEIMVAIVTCIGRTLDNLDYGKFMILMQIIEERYKVRESREVLAAARPFRHPREIM